MLLSPFPALSDPRSDRICRAPGAIHPARPRAGLLMSAGGLDCTARSCHAPCAPRRMRRSCPSTRTSNIQHRRDALTFAPLRSQSVSPTTTSARRATVIGSVDTGLLVSCVDRFCSLVSAGSPGISAGSARALDARAEPRPAPWVVPMGWAPRQGERLQVERPLPAVTHKPRRAERGGGRVWVSEGGVRGVTSS